MKKLYILSLALLAVSAAFAAPKIKGISNNGNWSNASTWDLNRLPKSLDTIIIQANQVLVADKSQTLGDVFIIIYGRLDFATAKLTLGANSYVAVMQGGTITGNNNAERISIGTNEVFRGGGAPVTGPSYASTSTTGFDLFSLPVKFVGFSVTPSSNTVLIQWSTAEEISAGFFEVERSADGNNWTRIGTVAAAGNTSMQTNYTFTDRSVVAPVAYYRIKQVDADGKFVFTAVKSAKTDKNETTPAIKILSAQGNVVLHFPKQVAQSLIVRFVTLGGQVVAQHTLNNALGQVVLPVDSRLKGNIVVSITNAADLHIAKQILL